MKHCNPTDENENEVYQAVTVTVNMEGIRKYIK